MYFYNFYVTSSSVYYNSMIVKNEDWNKDRIFILEIFFGNKRIFNIFQDNNILLYFVNFEKKYKCILI